MVDAPIEVKGQDDAAKAEWFNINELPMQFESKEPSHGAFTSLGNAIKGLVHLDRLVSTHAERSTVIKADACAFAKKDLLDEQYQWKRNLTFQFHESIV